MKATESHTHRDFSGCPVVKTSASTAEALGSNPGWGAKILSNIVANSIKTLKMVHSKKKNLEKKSHAH